MSNTNPAPPKSNFMQTFLLVTTLFLAYQLFFGNNKQAVDSRPAEKILARMHQYNKDLKPELLSKELQVYEKKLRSDFENEPDHTKNNVDKKAELKPGNNLDKKILEGNLLFAHTQYSAGINKNDTALISAAYTTLETQRRKYSDESIWRDVFNVEPNSKINYNSISPENLYQEVGQVLSQRNRSELVLGFFPAFSFLNSLVLLTGAIPGFSYAFAALLLAAIVRAIVWPLAKQTLLHSKQMSQLMPLVNELKANYQGQELNQKVMELHKEYGINPAAGCLPSLAQLPLFILIYQAMLYYKFEFKNGTFLWINSTTSEATNGFVAPSLGEQDFILIAVYGISMIVTTLLTPVSDPTNEKQQKTTGMMMAIMFSVMMFFFKLPSAFILYWIFTNILTTVQTLLMNRTPVPPLMKKVGTKGEMHPAQEMVGSSMFKSTGVPKIHKMKSKKKK